MNSKVLATLTVLFSCLFAISMANQDMINSLTVEVQKIAANIPPNGASYVNGIQSHGVINTDSFDISQTVSILQKKLLLPQEVVDKFKNIIFADSINFETFSLSINVNEGYITEFIGTARKSNNVADIAYMSVSSSGNLVAQYQTVETRSCHRVALWKKCHTNTQQVPRGFNAQEIEVITNTLRGSAYQYVLDQLRTPPVAITNFDAIKQQLLEDNRKNFPALFLGLHEVLQTDDSDQSDSLLEDLVKSVLMKVPEMKAEIAKDGDVIVNKIVNRGFNSYQQTANIEQYYGVASENIDMFLENLIGDLMLPEAYRNQFQSIVDDVVYADLNEWLGFDVAFSLGNGASCKYVCVLARKNPKGNKIDWLVANILANFDLAPSVFIVEETKSVGPFWGKTEEKARFSPAYITKHQLEIIFEFFQIISFTRFAEVLNIEVPTSLMMNVFAETTADSTTAPTTPTNPATPSTPTTPANSTTPPTDIKTKIMSALDMVKTGITSVTSLWTNVVNAFKTTKSSELKQILSGKGFSYFAQSSQVQKIVGLKGDYYPKFKAELMNRLQVPDDKQYDFSTVLDDFQYMDEQTWTAYQAVFSVGTNGECKFVTILAHRNETDNKIDFLLSDMKATFKLAPDVLVIQDSKSVLGGIYSDSKIRLQEMPRSLTNDDLKAVFDFFYIVAFKNFADLFGIKVDLPALN